MLKFSKTLFKNNYSEMSTLYNGRGYRKTFIAYMKMSF